MTSEETKDERAEDRDEPELERLRALLIGTNDAIESGADPDQVKQVAHDMLNPGAD